MESSLTQLTSHFLQNDNLMSKAELVETPNAGRGLVATQDLEKGEIIFAEKPLIIISNLQVEHRIERKTAFSWKTSDCRILLRIGNFLFGGVFIVI